MNSRDIAQQQATGEGEFSTRAVRAGHRRTEEGEHAEAMFMTSSFTFPNAERAKAAFVDDSGDNVYSRFDNPTVQAFEERLASLEGAERCIATASGMAATLALGMAHLQAGDRIVCSQAVFGSTLNLWTKYFGKFGVEVVTVDPFDLDAWRSAMTPGTKLAYLETPTNPRCEVVDIRAVADIVHAVDAKLVVDNCFCTPALQRPLELGADIVSHSATKFLDGQGRAVGGAICGSEADMEPIYLFMRSGGPSMSAFNAWVFLKGLETLEIRMRAQSATAMQVAEWLQQQPQVQAVYYSGLASHPGHELAKQQQSDFGAVLSFEVKGGQEGAWSVIDATQLCSLTGNLGDTRTTITHPSTTTHGRLSEEQRLAAGINPGLIRLSVGLESASDLIADLSKGLSAL